MYLKQKTCLRVTQLNMDITVDRELREYTHLVGLQNQMVNTSHLQTPLCEGTPSVGRHFPQEHTFLGWTPPLRGGGLKHTKNITNSNYLLFLPDYITNPLTVICQHTYVYMVTAGVGGSKIKINNIKNNKTCLLVQLTNTNVLVTNCRYPSCKMRIDCTIKEK